MVSVLAMPKAATTNPSTRMPHRLPTTPLMIRVEHVAQLGERVQEQAVLAGRQALQCGLHFGRVRRGPP